MTHSYSPRHSLSVRLIVIKAFLVQTSIGQAAPSTLLLNILMWSKGTLDRNPWILIVVNRTSLQTLRHGSKRHSLWEAMKQSKVWWKKTCLDESKDTLAFVWAISRAGSIEGSFISFLPTGSHFMMAISTSFPGTTKDPLNPSGSLTMASF